jgi:hypothetical protein
VSVAVGPDATFTAVDATATIEQGEYDRAQGRAARRHRHSHAAGYNLREGDYELVLDKKTLPEFAGMDQAERVSVSVKVGRQPEPVNFPFEVRLPQKPVRNVLDKE